MRKIIIIEGLPGVGKTTLVNAIKNKKIENITIIDEIINTRITIDGIYSEDEFIENDIQKINSIKDGIIIMDRGLISSLSYSQTKAIINLDYDVKKANNFFENYRNILDESKVIYLTNLTKDITIRSNDINNPYGSENNQKLLEKISIYNLKKYCKNYVIKEYYKKEMEQLIDEIIN